MKKFDNYCVLYSGILPDAGLYPGAVRSDHFPIEQRTDVKRPRREHCAHAGASPILKG